MEKFTGKNEFNSARAPQVAELSDSSMLDDENSIREKEKELAPAPESGELDDNEVNDYSREFGLHVQKLVEVMQPASTSGNSMALLLNDQSVEISMTYSNTNQ